MRRLRSVDARFALLLLATVHVGLAVLPCLDLAAPSAASPLPAAVEVVSQLRAASTPRGSRRHLRRHRLRHRLLCPNSAFCVAPAFALLRHPPARSRSAGRGGDDLTVDGCVELHPGPLLMHMPTTRTAEAKAKHAAFLANWAHKMGSNSLKGRSVHVVFVDESCSPPVTRAQTLALLDTADLLVTRQRRLLPDGTKRLRIQRWIVAHVDPQGNRVDTGTFPPAPCECERDELITLDDFSLEAPLGTTRPLWEHTQSAAAQPGSLDNDSIRTHRIVPEGPNLHAFRTGLLAQVKGFAKTRDERLFHAALDFPKRHLRMLTGLCSSRLRAKHLEEQLSGKVCVQAVSVEQTKSTEKTEDERAVASAVRLAKSGYVGKAARVLATEPAPRMEPELLLEKLRELHPLGELPDACVPITQPLPFVADFDVIVVRETARIMSSGCSAGPTAWTEELLFQALGHDELAVELAAMLSYIANGLPSLFLRSRLTRGWIVGIPKPGGGVRPIAIGETFLKVASALAMRYCARDITALFGDTQFGIARPGGAEEIVHRTRCFVRASHRSEIVVTLDFSNAFNSPSRDALWKAVKQSLPRLSGIFAVEYAQASVLLYRATSQSIFSTRGTRQGSVCGPVFFCALLQQALLDARAVPGVSVYAYMDDVTILARDAAAAQAAVLAILRHTQVHGMSLNASKCEWLGSDAPPNDDVFRRFKRPTAVKVLGASIAKTDELEARHLEETYAERRRHATFFRRLRDVNGPQGMSILTRCGVPRASYLCRTHDPDVVNSVVSDFDRDVLGAAQHIIGGDISPVVRAWLHLPARFYGGLGLRQMATVASTAYAASRDEALLGRSEDRTQQARMAVLDKDTAMRLSDTEIAPWLARAREEDGRAGGFASDHSLSVVPDVYSAALRGRYGIPVRGTPASVNCPGCHAPMSAMEFTAHGKYCSRIPGDNRNHAHSVLGKAFDAVLAAAGAIFTPREVREFGTTTCPACTVSVPSSTWSTHARICPRLSADERRRAPRCHGPDRKYQLSWNGITTVIDFTIVYEQASSHRGKTLTRCFNMAKARKLASYAKDCEKAGYTLVVGAVASTGLLSSEFAEELRRIATAGSLHPRTVLRRMSTAAVIASGGSLLNAERAMNLAPPRQYSRLPRPQTVAIALRQRPVAAPPFRPSEPRDVDPAENPRPGLSSSLPCSRQCVEQLLTDEGEAQQAIRDLHDAFWRDMHHQAAVARGLLTRRSSPRSPVGVPPDARRPSHSAIDERRIPRPSISVFRSQPLQGPWCQADVCVTSRRTARDSLADSSARTSSVSCASPTPVRPSDGTQSRAASSLSTIQRAASSTARPSTPPPLIQPTGAPRSGALQSLHRLVQDSSPPDDPSEPPEPTALPLSSSSVTSRVQTIVPTHQRDAHRPWTRRKQAEAEQLQQQPHAAVASTRT